MINCKYFIRKSEQDTYSKTVVSWCDKKKIFIWSGECYSCDDYEKEEERK